MKYQITIEETVVEDFLVEADSSEEAYENAERKYKTGEFVLSPGECQFKQMIISGLSEACTEWREF